MSDDFQEPLPGQTATTTSTAKPNYIGTDLGVRFATPAESNPHGTSWMNSTAGVAAATTPTAIHVPAHYVEGDELTEIGNMSPATRAAVQQALHDAGLLPKYTPGVIDNTTKSAFKEALAWANASGKDWQGALTEMVTASITAGGQVGGSGSGGRAAAKRAPLVFQLSNPDNVKAVAQKVARDLLGRKMSDTESKAFVDSFHAAERDYQSAAYGITNDSPDGTTITEAPDASVAADMAIRKANPTEVDATAIANTFNTFTDLLDGRL